MAHGNAGTLSTQEHGFFCEARRMVIDPQNLAQLQPKKRGAN
jgi:hypothetical protein